MVLPSGLEYSSRLAEGVIDYVEERKAFHVIEVSYRCGGNCPVSPEDSHLAGAILWADPSDTWVPELAERGLLLVNCGGDWLEAGIPTVSFDGADVSRTAADHLLARPRPQLAHVGHRTSANAAFARRRDALARAAGECHVGFAEFEIGGEHPSDDGRRLLQVGSEEGLVGFLRSLPHGTGLWCEDDYVAALVCRVATEAGIGVPGRLAVLGLGDYRVGRFHEPSISTIPQPGRLVGYEAARLLDAMLAHRWSQQEVIRLPSPAVIARASTGGAQIDADDVSRAHELIQRLATDGLTVGDLMKQMRVSQVTLNKRFKAAYDCTPGEYIRKVRLGRAKELLERTDLSVTRIATICGFENLSRFNIFFKRETGAAPSEYRRASRSV
jgi:LacI family transcriptional regulator